MTDAVDSPRACPKCGVAVVRVPGRPGPVGKYCDAHREPTTPERRVRRLARASRVEESEVDAESSTIEPTDVGFESELGQRIERALVEAEVLGDMLTRAAEIQAAETVAAPAPHPRRTRRPAQYVCGACGELGHNARTCRARSLEATA